MYLDKVTDGELSSIFVVCEMSVKTSVFLYQQIRDRSIKKSQEGIIESLKQYTSVNPFTWKGDKSDLSYFWRNNQLSKDEVMKISDKSLRQKVQNVINEMIEKGILTLQGNDIVLTDAGKDYIYSEEFISCVAKSDIEYNQNIIQCVKVEQQERKNKTQTTEQKNEKFVPQNKYANGEINFNDLSIDNSNELLHETVEKQEQEQLKSKPLYSHYCTKDEYKIILKEELIHTIRVPEYENMKLDGFQRIIVYEDELKDICIATNKDFVGEFEISKSITESLMSGKSISEALTKITTSTMSLGVGLAKEVLESGIKFINNKTIK